MKKETIFRLVAAGAFLLVTAVVIVQATSGGMGAFCCKF